MKIKINYNQKTIKIKDKKYEYVWISIFLIGSKFQYSNSMFTPLYKEIQ